MSSFLDTWRALRLFTFTDRIGLFDRLPQTAWYRHALESFLEDLKLQRTETLLDIGCGAGWLTLWSSRQTKASIGLDTSEKMLRRAEINRLAGAFESASFVQGDALALPFPDESFDVVTGTMLLPVLSSPGHAVSEMIRMLGPSGRLGLFLPSPELTPGNACRYADKHKYRGFERKSLHAWSMTGRRFSEEDLNSLFAFVPPAWRASRRLMDGMALQYIVQKPQQGQS
ncbi:class I SAM-dependent methyltransferase [Paenibacillus sp. MMS18-CY102]|uniref:class I SAM-dependent methyltransferase n=1 Tax=Paenibacillus sp. MMS18-CY102 TaxID=2682849 RepID=UPI001365562F|nr:methyltransferase domain-containing protein [Paenibacillus sp. MMS18-CY102]MWC29167.1 methyltransferase domain-containing protein [Paenibacillus sp. MMS18-CY102]